MVYTLIAFAEYTLDVMFYELMKQSDVLGILKYTYAYGLWACECMCSAVRAVVQTICAIRMIFAGACIFLL